MKKKLLNFTIAFLLSVTGAKAADILTLSNSDYETAWGTLTDYGTSGLKKVTTPATGVTDWLGQVGNGNLTLYQTLGRGDAGNAVLLSNTKPSPDFSRFGNSSVLSLTKGGMYKVTYYAKGNATLNVFLYKSGVNPTGATANGADANAIYSPTLPVAQAFEYGELWTKVEHVFTVPVASAFTDCRLFFALAATNLPAFDGTNLATSFVIDDVSIEPYVDTTIATLSEIKVGNRPVSNFNANTIAYSLLTNQQTIAAVTATATDINATVDVKETVYATGTASTAIEVTAADGTTKKTYTLNFEITKDLVVEGFGTDALPETWTTSKTIANGDFMVDALANYNNGLYLGTASLRVRGTGVTEAWLMISDLANPDALSFYLRAREAGASTLKVYKRIATGSAFTDLTEWTLCETFTAPFDATYTPKTVTIGEIKNTDILLYVEKEDNKIPFAIDDLRITKKETTVNIENVISVAPKLCIEKGKVSFSADHNMSYSVNTFNGLTLKSGQGSNVELQLLHGLYILTIDGVSHKILIP